MDPGEATAGRPRGGRAAPAGIPVPAVSRGRLVAVLSDVAAPLLLTGVAVHELVYDQAAVRTWLLVMALVWPLVLRRRAPLIVLGACLVVGVALWLSDTFTVADVAILVALYSVAAHRDLVRALAAAAVVEVGVVLLAVRFAPAGSINDGIVLMTGSAAAAFFLGTTFRAQRRYLASVEERAHQLEREREQQAALVAAAERSRIARELHDVIAHGLAVMVTLAQGASGVVRKDPHEAERAMHQVAAAGRESLTEMRTLLGVLRAPDDIGRAPQPNLSDLDELVDDVRSTGLVVVVTRTGQERLSPVLQATVFRLVQESLTNVLKHAADASRVVITLDHQPAATRFAVADDGRPGTGQSLPGSGNGLRGMQERVAMFGGTMTAGPTSSGWLVCGEIPVR